MRLVNPTLALALALAMTGATGGAPLVYERFEGSAIGTIAGGVTFDPDGIGPMVDPGSGAVANGYTAVFDGASGTYVSHGTTTQITSTDFTVEAFIRRDAGASGYDMIAADWTESGATRAWSFNLQADGALRFDISPDGDFNDGNKLLSPAGTIQPEKWYHVAAVSDGDDSRIYVDGVPAGSMTRPAPGIFTGDNANLKVGNVDRWAGGLQPFDGRIDELRITESALGRADFVNADRLRAWVQAEDGTPGNPAATVASTGAGPDGAASGGVTYSADVVDDRIVAPGIGHYNNESLDFDGNAGTYVQFGDTLDVEPGATGGFTVEAFVKPTSLSGYQVIASEWDEAQASRVWALALTGSGIRFDTSPDGDWYGNNKAESAGGVLQAGQWQHVAGVCDGTTSKIYVDGTLVATKVLSDPGLALVDQAAARIGAAERFANAENNLTGLLDEVRITQRALTPADFLKPTYETAWVAAEDGTPGNPATVVANSDPGPDGTASGGVAYSADRAVSHVATPGDGRPNNVSLDFDGNAGTYVEFDESLDVQPGPTNSFTVEAFIKPTALSGYEVIAAEWDDGGSGQPDPYERAWALALTGNQIRFDTSPDGGYVGSNKNQTGTAVAAGQWQHVAAVYDGATGTSRIYVNRQLLNEHTLTNPGIYVFDHTNLRVGAAQAFSSSEKNFPGLIDELRISPTALTPDQFLMPHTTAWIQAEEGTPGAPATTAANALPGPSGTAHGGVSFSGEVPGARILAPGVDHLNHGSLAFDGQRGTYVEFDGSLDVAPGPDGGFTIEAFIRPDTVSGTQVVASEWWDGSSAPGGTQDAWALALEGNRLRFLSSPDSIYHSDNNVFTPSGSIEAGEWQHVAAVYDGTTTKLYIDYVLEGETTLSHPGITLFEEAMLRLGAAHNYGGGSSNEQNYQGLIDEFRITDAVLTPDQFLRLPEPGTMALLALGLAALTRRRRR